MRQTVDTSHTTPRMRMILPAALATLATLVSSLSPAFSQPRLEIPDLQLEIGDYEVLDERVRGPIDNRFFGHYCQEGSREFCAISSWLPGNCVTLRDLEVRIDHIASRSGSRLLASGSLVLDGDRVRLYGAGSVVRRGEAVIAAHVPGLGKESGRAVLSTSGDRLTLSTLDRRFELSKTGCGNAAPRVALRAVGGPDFAFRDVVLLVADITDADQEFPPDRLAFVSDRQGLLSGMRVRGRTNLFTSNLQPGEHRITVLATDSGGLSGRASTVIRVENTVPEVSIQQPDPNETVMATAPVLLQGLATDSEDGLLADPRLRWEVEATPGEGFVYVGSGSRVTIALPEPSTRARIRLEATDSAGSRSTAATEVMVAPFGGNAAPIVSIDQPLDVYPDENLAFVTFAGRPTLFEGSAADLEDSLEDLEVRWDFRALGSNAPVPPPVEGQLAAEVVFLPAVNATYRATLTVRDSGGQATSRSIDFFVLSSPIE